MQGRRPRWTGLRSRVILVYTSSVPKITRCERRVTLTRKRSCLGPPSRLTPGRRSCAGGEVERRAPLSSSNIRKHPLHYFVNRSACSLGSFGDCSICQRLWWGPYRRGRPCWTQTPPSAGRGTFPSTAGRCRPCRLDRTARSPQPVSTELVFVQCGADRREQHLHQPHRDEARRVRVRDEPRLRTDGAG